MQERNKSLLEAMKEYVLQYPNLGDIDLHIDQTESDLRACKAQRGCVRQSDMAVQCFAPEQRVHSR